MVLYYSLKQSRLVTLLALLLIAIYDALLTTSALLPGKILARLSLGISLTLANT